MKPRRTRRRRECFVMPGGTYCHEGPVRMEGTRVVDGHLVDRFVCRCCGGELFALSRDVEALRNGMSEAQLLGLVRAHIPAPEIAS